MSFTICEQTYAKTSITGASEERHSQNWREYLTQERARVIRKQRLVGTPTAYGMNGSQLVSTIYLKPEESNKCELSPKNQFSLPGMLPRSLG